MLQPEIDWLEARFAELRDGVHTRIDEAHDRLDAAHRKLDAIVAVAGHLLPFLRGLNPMDHAALLDLAKKAETDSLAAADGAVTEFKDFAATHTAMVEGLDDVAAIVSGIPAKIADKLAAIKAPVETPAPVDIGAAGSASASGSTDVSIAAPTTAPTVTLPVSAEVAASTAIGSVVAGPGITDGATVIATTDNHPQTGGPALTIDDATTADHAVGDVVTVTPPAAAS